MDPQKIDALAERLLGDVNASMTTLNVYVGHRLGLWWALARAGAVTPAALASATGCAERYVRESLECMTVNDLVDHQPGAGTFSLSAEHAAVLSDPESPAYMAAFSCFVPSLAGALPPLLQAFRTGAGVPYEAYGLDAVEGIGMGNRPMFMLHCLPQAMVFPGAAGTGTVMGPSVLRRYAAEAGFARLDVLPIEHPLWRFYRLTA